MSLDKQQTGTGNDREPTEEEAPKGPRKKRQKADEPVNVEEKEGGGAAFPTEMIRFAILF